MASLRYSKPDEENVHRIGFTLQLLGYEKTQGWKFNFNFDWFECRLSIECFNKLIEHPRTNTLEYQELPYFINWLRELPSKEKASFETIEPFFRMDVETRKRGHPFNVTFLRSAYGVERGYLYIDSGLAVKFPVLGQQFIDFAGELETEMKHLSTQYSEQIRLWNEYKEAERLRWEESKGLVKKSRLEK